MKLFRPTFSRNPYTINNNFNIKNNKSLIYNSNIESTSSFRYNDKKYLVSTQQLNIDWEKFENHIFFHSAVAHVNEAFDRIINFYPFDKSKKIIEEYEDTLTGYEKYILDLFPKNIGYLNFSGTMVGEDLTNGTYINVIDKSGIKIQEISEKKDGAPVLDPLFSPFSIQMFVNPASLINDNQVLLQKKKSLANNFTLFLSNSNDINVCELYFGISSGSNYSLVSGTLNKGIFSHITAFYDKLGDQKIKLLIDEVLYESQNSILFDNLNFDSQDLIIGSGEDVRFGNSIIYNKQTFSGSIDELKVYHSIDSIENIKKNKFKTTYQNQNNTLKLYFKFNEPPGEYDGNNIILDSSGNSLHSVIENYIDFNRSNTNIPVKNELLNEHPILFPTYEEIINLNERLLVTASYYDDYNPNLITKLVPSHYFEEGTSFSTYTNEFDNLNTNISNLNGSPGSNKSSIPSMQLLIKLLLIYAKHFDQIKLLIDSITMFRNVNYNDFNTIPDVFLKEYAKIHNMTLPNILSFGNLDQLFSGINLSSDPSNSIKSLFNIQNEIWKRMLSEAPVQKNKKGTIDSIKSIFRNAGIEPDNLMNFREYGGSKIKSLDSSVEFKKDINYFINFTGSIGKEIINNNYQGYPSDNQIPYIKSEFLSCSRIEPGIPEISGIFVNKSLNLPNGISDNVNDGLLTSGSFTFEALYKFPKNYQSIPESLCRFHVTGTLDPSKYESCIINLIGTDEKINLYIQDSPTSNQYSNLYLDVNIFDGDIWHISFGKKNVHETINAVKSEYFLRSSKQLNGEIIEYNQTSSIVEEYSDSVLKNISEYNTSGSFIVIGSQSFQDTSNFLNYYNDEKSNTQFTGFITNLRFFSKYTTEKEWIRRSKSYNSYGVDNPNINYNFANYESGSFERLIIQTDAKQNTRTSDNNGDIKIFDFSQNNFHFNGKNFENNATVLSPVRTQYEILSDKFDINSTNNKIRIRSFQDAKNLNTSYFSTIAPVNEININEESLDDNRFSIDMSVMKGLNENILKMFSSFDSFDDMLGMPNLIFADRYPELNTAKEIFFNNLIEKPDLEKYRTIFKWIDNSFSDSVYSIVPRTTNFLGINFIYESHVLERNKFKYSFDEIYLKSIERDASRNNIFLSQFVCNVKKF